MRDNLTPSEKAIDLINKFKSKLRADNKSWKIEVKQCAISCVDEVITQVNGNNVTTDYIYLEYTK